MIGLGVGVRRLLCSRSWSWLDSAGRTLSFCPPSDRILLGGSVLNCKWTQAIPRNFFWIRNLIFFSLSHLRRGIFPRPIPARPLHSPSWLTLSWPNQHVPDPPNSHCRPTTLSEAQNAGMCNSRSILCVSDLPLKTWMITRCHGYPCTMPKLWAVVEVCRIDASLWSKTM